MLGGVLVVIAVLAGVAVGAGFMYASSLDSAMSLGGDEQAVRDVLGPEQEDAGAFYALAVGSDMRTAGEDGLYYDPTSGANGTGYSDVIMLVRVDPDAKVVTLLTIPRDTPITGAAGKPAKLNSAYHDGGPAQLISAVEDLTGVQISHYAEISGLGLEQLIDGLGGIDADVEQSFSFTTIASDEVYLEEGRQHLDGAQALALANMRTQYDSDQDVHRQSGARQVVAGILEAVRDRSVVEIPGVVQQAAGCLRTDMDTGDLVNLALALGGSFTVYTGSGPNQGSMDPYTSPTHFIDDSLWLCYVDDEGWQRVIAAVDAGEDPSDISYDGDLVHYAGQPEETWLQGLVTPDDMTGTIPL